MKRFVTSCLAAVLIVGFAVPLRATQPLPGAGGREQQREERQGALEKRLQEIGREMDTLAAEANRATGRARENLKDALAQLKERQRAVERSLEEMRRMSAETWEKARTNVEQALDDLKKAFDKARAPEGKQ